MLVGESRAIYCGFAEGPKLTSSCEEDEDADRSCNKKMLHMKILPHALNGENNIKISCMYSTPSTPGKF